MSQAVQHRANPFRRIARFFGETMEELRKASWPGREELRDSTILIILSVVSFGVFICVSDFSLYQLISIFTYWFGGTR